MKTELMKKATLFGGLYGVVGAIVCISFVGIPGAQHYVFPDSLRLVIFGSAMVFLVRYMVYMIVSPWHDVRKAAYYTKNKQRINAYCPKVSVIIPAWNEEVGLVRTVQSLLKSTYKNMEIVVINDGSTDESDIRMKTFLHEYRKDSNNAKEPIDIIYHYKENGGKGRALNAGVAMARGDIIVTIDADCMVDKRAIRNIVRCFADPAVMAAVGNVRIGNTTHILGVIQSLEFLWSFYFKKADAVLDTVYIIGGAAGAFRKEVFKQLGGYDETSITEDIELSVRIQKSGMKIAYASDAIIYTEGASTLRGLLQQRLRWKRGRLETFIRHKDMFFSTEPQRKKLLSWIVLPYAVLGDAQIPLELPFLFILYVYGALTYDFSPFFSAITLLFFIFVVYIGGEHTGRQKWFVYFFAPIAWLLFYVITVVELYAFISSLWGIYRHEEIKWQKWMRIGVLQQES